MKISNWIAGLIVVATYPLAHATPVQWNTGTGANNHFYDAVLVPTGISWDTANAAATARGGYLATITSANENSFVYGLVSQNTAFWFIDGANNSQGPWLGGLQPDNSTEPGGNWKWVTGENFTSSDGTAVLYTNWNVGEPNNSGGSSTVNSESRLQFFGSGNNGNGTPKPAPFWNDVTPSSPVHGYIVEFDVAPVPEPETYALMLAGIGVVTCLAKRRRLKAS